MLRRAIAASLFLGSPASAAPDWGDHCTMVAVDRAFLVHFPPNSSVLGEREKGILTQFATAWKSYGGEFILVQTHIDRAEADHGDTDLGARRGMAIVGYLGAQGIPSGSVAVQNLGAQNPMVPSEPGQAEPANRFARLHSGQLEADYPAPNRAKCYQWFVQHCFAAATEVQRNECGQVLNYIIPDVAVLQHLLEQPHGR